MMKAFYQAILTMVAILLLAPIVTAGELTVPNSFSSGTAAVAAEVNDNFGAVKTAVDDNNNRIAALEATIATLQATIATLQTNLAGVQSNSVLALDGYLSYTVDPRGYATAQFAGVNVQVVNGVSQSTPNGLGNLIVGYNNPLTSGYQLCSDGQYVDQPTCEANGEIWALSHKTGSHNLVAGDGNSYSRTGGVVFGTQNAINGIYASVTGGRENTARRDYSSITGGYRNNAKNLYSSISGGYGNSVAGIYTSVTGGYNNQALATGSSISGGKDSIIYADGDYGSISGGQGGSVHGIYSSISGGFANVVNSNYSSISGGSDNSTSSTAPYSSILGGQTQTTTSSYQTIP